MGHKQSVCTVACQQEFTVYSKKEELTGMQAHPPFTHVSAAGHVPQLVDIPQSLINLPQVRFAVEQLVFCNHAMKRKEIQRILLFARLLPLFDAFNFWLR